MSDIRIKMAKDLRDMSDMVGDLHWMAAKAVEDLIKKDARIVELESELVLRREDHYRMDAELAAIKAQGVVAWRWSYANGGTSPVYQFPEPDDDLQQAGLAAEFPRTVQRLYAAPVSEAKAQEPDCDRSACGDFSPGPCDNPDCSARRNRMVVAPVAKPQVVMPERETELFNAAYGAAVESGWESVKCMARQIWDAARLNATPVMPEHPFCEYCGGNDEEPQDHCMDCTRPVQQVSVPDGWRELLREIEQFFEGAGVSPGPDIELRMAAMLAAAPAAPAADAGLVEALEKLARLGNGDQYGNSEGNFIAQAALAAHRAKGVV